MPYFTPNRPPRQDVWEANAFTLLELLICISIIAALLGLSAMGADVLRGRQLDRASGQVTMMFDHARQHSLSRNTPTAVVILNTSGTDSDGRALALFEYQSGTGWKQLQRWEMLPERVCMGVSESSSTGDFSSGLPYETPEITFRGKTVSAGQYLFSVFLPGRGLLKNDGEASLPFDVIEGKMINGQMRRQGRSPEYYKISLLTVTGRYKLERYAF